MTNVRIARGAPSRQQVRRSGRGAAAIGLVALTLLAGCATVRTAPPVSASSWLLGGWVLQGESCNSDAGVIYRGDGTWIASEVGGTWTLAGDRLALNVTQGEGAGRRTPIVERIERLGPNDYIAHRAGIRDRHLVRCIGGR